MASEAGFLVRHETEGAAALVFFGNWSIHAPYPSYEQILKELSRAEKKVQRIAIFEDKLEGWDSSLVSTVYSVAKSCRLQNISIDFGELSDGLQGLIRLAFAVEPQKRSAAQTPHSFFSRIGVATLASGDTVSRIFSFIGEISIAFARFVSFKSKVRKADLLEIIQQAGPAGLPIVSLISLLVGLILAYIGAIQLQQFGAQIYVANLVGIAMAREMGGVMASIIMAGRTGAAFAAQLGTMQVNEEIDALKTAGISPIEFLVLPRMLALIVMNPLLCLYAILAGILGGLVVSVGVLDIPLVLYYDQTVNAIKLADVCVGVVKSIFFGVLVALCGCYHGIRCGRNASAVGEATTAAVVSSIVCVVVADAIFAILTNIIGL